MPSIVDFSCDASVEDLLSRFNSTCSNVLNAVAPFRSLQSKIRSEPSIDDSFVLLDDVVEERNESGKRTSFMFLLRF